MIEKAAETQTLDIVINFITAKIKEEIIKKQ